MFCKHDWIKIGMPRHLKYDYSGNEVVIILCHCKKMRKAKRQDVLWTYHREYV